MTQHDIAARAPNFVICVIALVALGAALAHVQTKDVKDDCAARGYIKRQAKAAAQPDTWAKLDADGRRMTNYDGIRK